MARPMPLEAPVTTAVRPSSSLEVVMPAFLASRGHTDPVERFVLAAVLVALAVVVALVLDRRRPDAPTAPRWAVPSQLDRADFTRPDVPWLVAVFTSATCNACAGTAAKAAVLASAQVAVEDVEFGLRPDLHRRYGIDAAPLVVVADAEGVVRASFVGPPTATDLWAAVAELREPGSTPEGCDHGAAGGQAGAGATPTPT